MVLRIFDIYRVIIEKFHLYFEEKIFLILIVICCELNLITHVIFIYYLKYKKNILRDSSQFPAKDLADFAHQYRSLQTTL